MDPLPHLQTERLTIRPFAISDLDDICNVLDASREDDPFHKPMTPEARREWLQWMVTMTVTYGAWYPPFGDFAVVRRDGNTFIGAVGFGCDIEPFDSLPYLGGNGQAFYAPEISLYWEIGKAHRRQGYAAEAAQALIDYAFNVMRVKRLFALTHPDNVGSLGVMRKLGMYIERAQGACGILHNPAIGGHSNG